MTNERTKSDYEQAQADGEYIPKQAVLENIDQWYEDKADIEDLIVKITYMPSVAIPNKVGHLENVDTTKSICSICGVVFSITVPEEYNDREVSHCPFCGCPMEIER